MKKTCLIILLCIAFLESQSQGEYKPGYIILDRGDSIAGFIAVASESRNAERCVFKNDSMFQSFSPLILQCYQFISGKRYESKIVREGEHFSRMFVEVLLKGEKNLYRYFDAGSEKVLIDRGRDTVFVLPYSVRTVYSDGKRIVRSTTHRYFLKEYFKDCPALFKNIEEMVEPTVQSVEGLARRYYTECKDSSALKFRKEHGQIGNALGLRYAFSGYNGVHGMTQDIGVLFFLSPPTTRDDRLFFKTGFYYTTAGTANDFKVIRIPLQGEYLFFSGTVRPKIDFGFNIFRVKTGEDSGGGLSTSIGGGFLIAISRSTFFDITVNADPYAFHPFSPVESFVYGSVEGGLYIKL